MTPGHKRAAGRRTSSTAASGAVTHMNKLIETPSPNRKSAQMWVGGISRGGAAEAITVIPSLLDQSCQLKSPLSKWLNYAWLFIGPSFAYFPLMWLPWFAQVDGSWMNTSPLKLVYFFTLLEIKRDMPTKRWLEDLFSADVGEKCYYRTY